MKTAIIIGATSGLGKAVAELLVEQGWKVGIAGRRKDRLEEICSRINGRRDCYQKVTGQEPGRGSVCAVQMDVTRPDAVEALDALIAELGGAPDMLLYSSGMGFQNRALDEELELQMVKTNCEGMVRIVDHFFNHVRNNRQHYSKDRKSRARIGVITSVAGTAGMGTCPAYSATKKMMSTYVSALVQLSRMEKVPVTFTDIQPGFVATEILDPSKNYPMVMQTDKAANLITKALRRRRRTYIFDWRFRMIVNFWKAIPQWLWERLTIVTN